MTTKYSKRRTIDSLNYIVNYEVISKLEDDRELFGFHLEMFKYEDNTKIILEEETVTNLTYSINQIQELLLVLYNNTVMPCELVYVIDDYISSNPNFIFDDLEFTYEFSLDQSANALISV